MDSLYLLIPLSAGLVLMILGIFGWALHRGQFEDLEGEGERILTDDVGPTGPEKGPGSAAGANPGPLPGLPKRGEE
jgi:cbb3-type cytochrome oxidase maturation protein